MKTRKIKNTGQTAEDDTQVFFTKDYPKILRRQKLFPYPCSEKELQAWELCVFQNYLIRKCKGDWITFLYDLEDLLKKHYPQALKDWHTALKEKSIRGGFIDWARKNPTEVF